MRSFHHLTSQLLSMTQRFAIFSCSMKSLSSTKGLESGRHEEFIDATRTFVSALRAKPNLAEHIHVVWYVVNAASGRIEPFEVCLSQLDAPPAPFAHVVAHPLARYLCPDSGAGRAQQGRYRHGRAVAIDSTNPPSDRAAKLQGCVCHCER